jgi:hypothetical protein
MKQQTKLSVIYSYILTTKLLFRIFAAITIIILGATTMIITYKTQIDVWIFFKFGELKNYSVAQYIMISISILIGIATIVQSSPPIWNHLSNWGQQVDNFLILKFTGHKFFLYEAEEQLNEMRKIIIQTNTTLQNYIYQIAIDKVPKDLNEKISKVIKYQIFPAIKLYSNVVKILKENQTNDNINKSKKDKTNIRLNYSIEQITELLTLVITIKRQYT